MIREHEKAPEGKKAKHRRDRVTRARGGKVGHKKGATHVNVIVNGGGKEPMPIPVPAGGPPMPPPGMAPPPVAGLGGPPPGMPPGGPPPGMIPPRARGGKVKSGPAWEEGRRDGTQVQPSPGKGQTNTPENLHRGRPITFSSGGVVKSFRAYGGRTEAPKGMGGGPKLPGGVVSGESRLVQAARTKRRYAKPIHEDK